MIMTTAPKRPPWPKSLATPLATATLLVGVLSATAPAMAATTYHVRTDGSDKGCTGKADAPYPGAATGGKQPCAFATPQRAADEMSGSAGDDIVIHAGTYVSKVTLKRMIRPRAG